MRQEHEEFERQTRDYSKAICKLRQVKSDEVDEGFRGLVIPEDSVGPHIALQVAEEERMDVIRLPNDKVSAHSN